MGRKRLLFGAFFLVSVLQTTAQQGTSNFEFIENKGQWDPAIKFRGEIPAGAFYLQQKGFTVLLHNQKELRELQNRFHGHGRITDKKVNDKLSAIPDPGIINGKEPITLHSHSYRVQFAGANESIQIIPDRQQSSHNNYFIGNDPSKWAKNVKIFQAATYKNVYPNIDVRYYSENGKLKYDIIVNPGGDVSKIAMKYEGADKLSIKNKELLITTSVATVKELYPYTFQFDPAKGKKEINCKYEISGGNTVKFNVSNYDRNTTLVIDPTLIFSTFTGSPANNYGFTATPAPDGSFFSGSIVFGSGFPTTPGAFQGSFSGGSGSDAVDIGIMKFNSTGTARLYSTYLGGSGNEFPHSLYSDAQGNLVVMGRTYSSNFPTTVTPNAGAAACDIFVTKLNVTGTALIGSMRIGGDADDGVNIEDHFQLRTSGTKSLLRNYGDESRSEVVLDRSGNIYVAGPTKSGNFPIVGGFQTIKGAAQDGVVLKINPNCNSIIWSSFLGGNGDDGAFVLEIDPITNNVYVAGATASTNFPTTSGVAQGAFAGGEADGFVTEISNNGSSIIKSTYLGTSSVDIIYGIKFDRKGFPYVMGTSRGSWPVSPGVWSVPGSRQFVTKLKPDLSGNVYSTVFGSGAPKPNMSPVAFLVDRCENVYISGWGGYLIPGTDPYDLAGVVGMPTTADAIKKVTDNRDMYFIVIKKDAASLLYGSFFGENEAGNSDGEHVDGGTSRFDEQGVIYQAICANCNGSAANFPVTPGVVGPVNLAAGAGGCNLAAVKISFNFAGVASGPKAFINGVKDSVGCVPLTFEFRDTVLNAKSYEWDFGDGSPGTTTTTAQITHTYTLVGDYRIRLIAVDSTTCNIRDTAFINVKVRNDQANLSFNPVKLPPCESLSYRFDNSSIAPTGKPFGANSFVWDFGDGNRVISGLGAVTHSFASAGTYKVRLVLVDTNYCNSPDSMEVELRIAPNVDAQFLTPADGCVPHTAVFTNTSAAGQSFRWDFGDGSSASLSSPSHLYSTVGTYRVKLVAIDSATCNIIDSVEQTITVHPVPVAAFSFTPIVPEINKPTIFTNQATGGVRFKWLFGDGDSVIKTTPDTVLHQYNATGTFTACLVVFNQFNCSDTICQPVSAQIVPVLDVPNAFTPGRFGRNSVIRVEGFGIGKMNWKIYNRWGQVVYQSSDRKGGGWDGTMNGKPQPMDVYAYTLEVEFSDGTKARKTGDITLIR